MIIQIEHCFNMAIDSIFFIPENIPSMIWLTLVCYKLTIVYFVKMRMPKYGYASMCKANSCNPNTEALITKFIVIIDSFLVL